jgi:release factor glutamine methyltransferase
MRCAWPASTSVTRAEPAAGSIAALVRDAELRLRGSRYVEHPTADARELVAAVLEVPRSWPVQHAAAPAGDDVRAAVMAAAAQLAAGAPIQYAVGRAAFRNLVLDVDPRVLIPRPETELLVDLVLGEDRDRPGGTVVDVGTGSGAIAIALATEGRYDRVIAIDVSLDALAVARANAAHAAAGARCAIDFRHGSLLGPVAGLQVRTIVSNPPYIAQGEASALPAHVRDWEPSVALFSGPSGMDATVRLVRQAAVVLEAGGLLAMEVDTRRAALVAECVAADGRYRDVGVRLDLTGRERFVLARRLHPEENA